MTTQDKYLEGCQEDSLATTKWAEQETTPCKQIEEFNFYVKITLLGGVITKMSSELG